MSVDSREIPKHCVRACAGGVLHTVEIWCCKVGLLVNRHKTVLNVFTRKRKLPGRFEPLFFRVTLHHSTSVTYLGLVLDSWLTCRKHVNIMVKKAHNSLWACRRTSGVTQDLWPEIVYWLHLSIIQLSITFASLVWWPGWKTDNAKKKLRRIQRLVCLGIMGYMHTIPAGAMEALTCLPPHSVVVQGEARSAAH